MHVPSNITFFPPNLTRFQTWCSTPGRNQCTCCSIGASRAGAGETARRTAVVCPRPAYDRNSGALFPSCVAVSSHLAYMVMFVVSTLFWAVLRLVCGPACLGTPPHWCLLATCSRGRAGGVRGLQALCLWSTARGRRPTHRSARNRKPRSAIFPKVLLSVCGETYKARSAHHRAHTEVCGL
jgi:hypothetical protein